MSVEPSEDKAAIEDYVDALDHIRRVCKASRTQTRRLRWIEARARCAVEGGQDWRDLDLPASADSQSKRILNLIQDRSELAEALQRLLAFHEPDSIRDQHTDLRLKAEADRAWETACQLLARITPK